MRGAVACYSDSNWDTPKSTSGLVLCLSGTPLVWSTKLQPVVSRSSCEAELIALNTGAVELMFMSHLLGEMLDDGKPVRGFNLRKREKDADGSQAYSLAPLMGLTLQGDNQSANRIALGGATKRVKHISIRFLAMHQEIRKGFYNVAYVGTADNLADGFTKALARAKWSEWVKKLYGR